VLGLISAGFRIAVELTAPTLDDIGRQLIIAGRDTPGNFLDRWTVFRIAYLPVVPAFVIFLTLLAVTNAFFCGATFYRAIRRANGQPATLIATLHAATTRVPQFIGWYLLASTGTGLALLALLLPGTITRNPWLNLIGPTIAALLLPVAIIVVVPTIFGVVFLERRGLRTMRAPGQGAVLVDHRTNRARRHRHRPLPRRHSRCHEITAPAVRRP
jgi:hypothetical protein